MLALAAVSQSTW